MNVFETCISFIERDGRAVLVRLTDVRGSAPREAGAAMALGKDGHFSGTIGGGQLEWQALELARAVLAGGPALVERDIVLGPDLGQCCGGRVRLRVERLTGSDVAMLRRQADETRKRLSEVALFGAGHVGRALVLALAPLPFQVRWVDQRDDIFPCHVPGNVICDERIDAVSAVAGLASHSLVVIVTHDHALDLALVRACLLRGDLGFVGLIGSASKRARFRRRLAAGGIDDKTLDRLVCPIGAGSLRSKEPAVIAAGIAVQLLEQHEQHPSLPKTNPDVEARLPSLSLASMDR